MSYANAETLEALYTRLSVLRDKATDDAQKTAIQAKLDQISPYLEEAGNVVLTATGHDFELVAGQLKTKLKPINDAIADISKINAALTTAAQIINQIVGALGAVGPLLT